jgi:hypothetical protein
MTPVHVFMILVHESRTGQSRHYRLLTVNGSHVEDITRDVCTNIDYQFDSTRGTYQANGSLSDFDGRKLARALGETHKVFLL